MTSISLTQPLSSTRARAISAVLATDDSLALFLLRVVLGGVLLPHGLQKTLGWFGGYGFEGTMGGFTSMGIPAVFAFLAILAESAGAVALIAGFGTRIASLGAAAVMAVAGLMVHRAHFFMNWSGQQGGEGFEYHLLAGVIAVVLVLGGAGRWSIDRAVTSR